MLKVNCCISQRSTHPTGPCWYPHQCRAVKSHHYCLPCCQLSETKPDLKLELCTMLHNNHLDYAHADNRKWLLSNTLKLRKSTLWFWESCRSRCRSWPSDSGSALVVAKKSMSDEPASMRSVPDDETGLWQTAGSVVRLELTELKSGSWHFCEGSRSYLL